MKPTWLIGLSVILVALIILCVLVLLGFIQMPWLDTELSPGDEDAPPGAVYCDYTDMQILDMIETTTGKDLDNSIGVSFVRALNMEACGSDDVRTSDITVHYKSLYSDWHISDDASSSGGGWTAHRIVWLNSADPSSATLARAVMIGEGITVEMAYGYDTITIISDGPVLTYGAFIVWVASS